MTKENLKTGLIVVLLIATVVLFRQYYIYKVQVEICDLHSVQLEFYFGSGTKYSLATSESPVSIGSITFNIPLYNNFYTNYFIF